MNSTVITPAPPPPPVFLEAHAPAKPIPLKLVRTSSLRQPRNGSAMDVSDIQPSMQEHGLLQPIWVRTRTFDPPDRELGGFYYEIIFGERRTFAADKLGWVTIEAVVRDDLSELDIFLIQLEENERRKPLSLLEQADAVKRLMEPKATGGFGITDTAEIAMRLNISVTTVYQRIALARTTAKVRAAFTEGKIFAGAMLALASIGDPAAQDEALAECLPENGDPQPVRRVAHHVEARYHLRLTAPHVPFNTTAAELVEKVPACAACPKRTGADAQIPLLPEPMLATVKREDRCTDRVCYAAKRVAWRDREIERAKAAGIRTVTGKEGKDLYPAGFFLEAKAPGLVDIDRMPPFGGAKTFRELVGDSVPFAAFVVDGDDRVHYLVDKAALTAALERKGLDHQILGPTPPADGGKAADSPKGPKAEPPSKPEESFAVERKAAESAALEAMGEIAERAARRKVDKRFYRFVLRGVVALAAARLEPIVERRALRATAKKGAKDIDLVSALLETDDEGELRGLLAEICAGLDGLHPSREEESHALAVATRFYGVDLDSLTKEHTKRLRAEAKRAGKPGAAPSPKAKSDKPNGKAAAPAPAAFKTGVCSACRCDDDHPCLSGPTGTGDACVWADTASTLCSVCAHIEAVAVEIVEEGEKSPNEEELACTLAIRLEQYEVAITEARRAACIADAIARKKLVMGKGDRFQRTGPRVVDKGPNAGATPATNEPPPLRSRITRVLRHLADKSATRRELINAMKNAKPSATPAETIREISLMTAEGMIGTDPTDNTAPIKLLAPTYEEVAETLDELTPAEVRARWTDVMRTAAPGIGLGALKAKLATRLSGELPPAKPNGSEKKRAKG